MRVVRTLEDTTLDKFGRGLLSGRPRREEASLALDRLAAANPHVSPERLPAGTVVFVPDAPGFEARAGAPIPASVPIEEFQALAAAAFETAERDLKDGFEAREAQRRDIAAAIESDAFRRLADRDERLQEQGKAALVNLEKESEGDRAALDALPRAGKAALEALARLAGRHG